MAVLKSKTIHSFYKYALKHSRPKINVTTLGLNYILKQMELIEIHKKFHLPAAEYTVFSSPHGTFSLIDYTLGHTFVGGVLGC